LNARQVLTAAGYNVVMTRAADKGVQLEDRVNFANKFQNALFVSIHFNSSGGAEGLETYALAPAGVVSNAANEVAVADTRWSQGNAQDEQNIALCTAVHASVLSQLTMIDRGVKHARFYVLRNIKIPAVLVECGFLNNTVEGYRVASPQFRQQVGVAIAQAVKTYDAAVNYRAEGQTFASARIKLPLHSRSITEPIGAYVPAEMAPADKPSLSISGGDYRQRRWARRRAAPDRSIRLRHRRADRGQGPARSFA